MKRSWIAFVERGNDTGESFNAFWDGRGLFHDVFEHAHEFTDKHFVGDAAMNIGGEVAAMGSLWYYHEACNMHNRYNSQYGYVNASSATINNTLSYMKEVISSDDGSFSSPLVCSVPYQKPTDSSELEYMIQSHFDQIKDTKIYKNSELPGNEPLKDWEVDSAERCKEYKNSITKSKLTRLYRYGYNMAKKMFPIPKYNPITTLENGNRFHSFCEFWNKFCQNNPAEELQSYFTGIVFTIYRNERGLLEWQAEFLADYGTGAKNQICYSEDPDSFAIELPNFEFENEEISVSA